MKTSFLYVLTFIVAFLAVTGALVIANEKFQNIFVFDFSPAHSQNAITKSANQNKQKADSLNQKKDSVNTVVKDTLNTQQIAKNETPVETNGKKQEGKNPAAGNTVKALQNNSNKKSKPPEVVHATTKVSDSTYNKWKKATIKLYESMDAKKVAQIIKSLADKEAREIIYAMKKKKAAEVLSNLNTEEVKRLTRLQ